MKLIIESTTPEGVMGIVKLMENLNKEPLVKAGKIKLTLEIKEVKK